MRGISPCSCTISGICAIFHPGEYEVITIKDRTACFTGHRTIPFLQKKKIKKRTKQILIEAIEQGYRYFGVGGALGFDMLAAQTVLELKGEYPEIKLILVLPCENQTRGWDQAYVEEYERKTITAAVCTNVTDTLLITAAFASATSLSNPAAQRIP